MTGPDWLKRAAQRSVEEDWMLGQTFERYRELEGYSPEQLATQLGCTVESLQWLSLCRRPEGDSFAEHVLLIARRFALDASRLGAVLRHVQVMDVLVTSRDDGEGAAGNSLLLAARDRSDDETNS